MWLKNRMLSIIQMDMLKLPADVAPVVHWVLTDENYHRRGRTCFAGTSISAR